MRKKHPLDVYCSGRPFRGSDPNSSLSRVYEDLEPGGPEEGESGEAGATRAPAHSWRRGWRPKAIFGSCAALALLGLVWAGSWAYTGQVWPDWLKSASGDPVTLQSQWPDRRTDASTPGGGPRPSETGVEYVLLVASGWLPKDEAEHRRVLENWERDERRLQDRLDQRFPDSGLVVRNKFIEGQDNLVGLFVLSWYDEDDPELSQVRKWVQELESRFAKAAIHPRVEGS